MRTVTICANKGFGLSNEHTYLLSLGYKKETHDEMNDMFATELKDLNDGKWMYSGKYKLRVFVITKVLVMSADRPERNSLTHIFWHIMGILPKDGNILLMLINKKYHHVKFVYKNG